MGPKGRELTLAIEHKHVGIGMDTAWVQDLDSA